MLNVRSLTRTIFSRLAIYIKQSFLKMVALA
ncbi:hypothetical protein SWAIN_7 [Serratia phage vB_SmaS_Swain]|nr:hypothetical protein SWAIN_7 [Serratia phage vB_SmaS_Swain]